MNIRIISVGESAGIYTQDFRSMSYAGVVYEEHVASVSEIEVHDSDNMAIIIALDNYDVAVEIARSFYQKGVLTIGLSDKKIEENGCFDAQHLYRSYNICGIPDFVTHKTVFLQLSDKKYFVILCHPKMGDTVQKCTSERRNIHQVMSVSLSLKK